jgi:hypothetical protein
MQVALKPVSMAAIRYSKIKFKIKYINAIYNIIKIDNDNKLTFKLLKIIKQVTIGNYIS